MPLSFIYTFKTIFVSKDIFKSAVCVQEFDDSLVHAIHIIYRTLLRSSSLREPRYPLLKVSQKFFFFYFSIKNI